MSPGGALNDGCFGTIITLAFGFGFGTAGGGTESSLFSKCCSLKRVNTPGDSVNPAGADLGSVGGGVDDGGGMGGGDFGIGDLAFGGIMSWYIYCKRWYEVE